MKSCLLYLATSRGPIALHQSDGEWWAHHPLHLEATAEEDNIHACMACDPARPERVFFGLPDVGVWRSEDTGRSWRRVFRDLPYPRVTALAVAPSAEEKGAVYAGTEPAALFVSKDDGETSHLCEEIETLPSAKSWSFPPRPDSNHVRWIQARPNSPENLLVAIEAGALVTSRDGGRTWRDRVPDSPIDTHQLAVHSSQPGVLWSAAGDGIFGSIDGGETWHRAEDGLPFHYGWSIAMDTGDSATQLLSAAPDAGRAHDPARAHSGIFRRQGAGAWTKVTDGLPPAEGRHTAVIAEAPGDEHVFHAAVNGAVYRSEDAGRSWKILPLDWEILTGGRRIHALVSG